MAQGGKESLKVLQPGNGVAVSVDIIAVEICIADPRGAWLVIVEKQGLTEPLGQHDHRLRAVRELSCILGGGRIGIVGDEESEESEDRGSDFLVDRGLTGEFAITGEPTDLHIGVAAKGVLALKVTVAGRAAHGSTPWLGDNAILRAIEMFRGLESLPFARESSEHFDRPSINLGRIQGGDALNRVPDRCTMDVDIRYLPNQDPIEI